MKSIYRDIFCAIHEGKWLSIEYRNKGEEITKYWIGIKDINPIEKILKVEGLHLGRLSVQKLERIHIDSILSSYILEGTYCPINETLVEDIYMNPYKYQSLFDNAANMEILSYLEMCHKLDTTPYIKDYELVRFLDRAKVDNRNYSLTDEQFKFIVKKFQYKARKEKSYDNKIHMQELAVNERLLSCSTGSTKNGFVQQLANVLGAY